MSFTIYTILPTSKKLLVVLLLAASMFCTSKADKYDRLMSTQIKPESVSHSEASLFFMNNQKYFTPKQRLDFLNKIGTMVDDDVSPPKQPNKLRLRGVSGAHSMMQLVATSTEVTEPPKTATQAMEEAIDSSEKVVEYLQSLTISIIDKAKKAKKDVAKWKNKIKGLTEESLEEYIVKVAEVTVVLNNSSTEARNMMRDMLDLVTIAVNDMRSNMNDNDALKEAVASAQIIMSVKMDVTAERLKELEIKVAQAQVDFEVLADKSASFSQIITDNLNNKNGYIDKKANEMRTIAYASCAACVLFPATCPICYGVAVGVVETQIKELKDDLKDTKNALKSIRGNFDSLEDTCIDFADAAALEYSNMNDVRFKLESTYSLVVANDSLFYWKRVVLPRLEKLQTLLEETLDTTFEEDDFDE